MLWAALGVGVPIALVLIALLVGRSLPDSHTASRMIRLHRSADRVWRELTTVDKFMEWRGPPLEGVERLPDRPGGKAAWVERWKGMGRVTFEVVEQDPPRRLVTRIVDQTLPFGGGWTFEVEGFEGNCTVTISETGVIKPPMFRFLSRFMLGYTRAIDDYLRALGARCDEQVQPLPTSSARPAPLSVVYPKR
jgi:hypothetical protein